MSTFGDVTYADAPAATSDAAASNGDQSQSQLPIDPNDPRLTSEILTVNPEADAYAILPPLPDGKWIAKAKQVDIKDDKGTMQRYAAFSRAKMSNGALFFATNVEYTIIDNTGDFDGVKLTEYWVKTLVDARKNTSQVATLIGKLGGKTPTSGTQLVYMETLLTLLASEPTLILETAWSAECQHCQEVAKKTGQRAPRPFMQGMHRFPATRTPGVHDPIVQCTVCKQQVRAQARIVAPYSLKEAMPTRGVAK